MTSESLLPAGWPLQPDRPFTVKQARAAGVARKLPTLARGRVLRRVVHSVYVAECVPDSIDLRAQALALVVPSGCFVTDRCAGWLHGAPMVLAPNEDVLIPRISFFRPSDEGRLRNGLCVSGERAVKDSDLMELAGITVTTPLRTALDLGRLQRPDVALAGLDAMASLGRFTIGQLVAEAERFAKQRGVRQLRELAPLTDAGSESFGESALRRRWYAGGLPRPTTQIPVHLDGVEIYRLDLGLDELLFATEYNGARWHTAAADRAHDAERVAWLTKNRGYLIEPFVASDLFGFDQNAEARLAVLFDQARETFAQRRRAIIY